MVRTDEGFTEGGLAAGQLATTRLASTSLDSAPSGGANRVSRLLGAAFPLYVPHGRVVGFPDKCIGSTVALRQRWVRAESCLVGQCSSSGLDRLDHYFAVTQDSAARSGRPGRSIGETGQANSYRLQLSRPLIVGRITLRTSFGRHGWSPKARVVPRKLRLIPARF